MNNKNGFALVPIIIVVAIIVIGGSIYYLSRSPKVTSQSIEEGSINIVSPNGGEEWAAGTTHEIRWESSAVPSFYGKDRLVLALVNTAVGRQQIALATPSDLSPTGSFNWQIPPTLNGSYIIQIRVTGTGDKFIDESDKPFKIVGGTSQAPKIDRIDPTSGSMSPKVVTEVVDKNEIKELKIFGSGFVTAKDNVGFNEIILSSEAGIAYLGGISLDGKTLVIDRFPTHLEDPSIEGKDRVKEIVPGKYEVYVSNAWGKSNSAFLTLNGPSTPSIEVLYPKGGEVFKVGSTITIKWEAKYAPITTAKINIILGRNMGAARKIFSGIVNDGAEDWQIPTDIASGDYSLAIDCDIPPRGRCSLGGMEGTFKIIGGVEEQLPSRPTPIPIVTPPL